MRSAVVALALVTVSSSLAEAAELKELVVAVPTARGKTRSGKTAMTAGVREGLAEALAAEVDPKALEAARRRRRRSLRRFRPRAWARLGREVEADYIVDLYLSRKGRRYSVRARLVRATDGAIQMDERLYFQKPRSQARSRGAQIADKLLTRLAELFEAGETPLALAPAEVAVGSGAPPAAEAPPEVPAVAEARVPPPAEPEPAPPAPPAATVTLGRPAERPSTLDLALGAGAGFLRTYDLSSTEGTSPLGYTLDPVSLIELQAALRIPRTGLVLGGRGALRLVGYQLVDANGLDAQPRGQLIDVDATLGWVFGSEVLSLTPRVGFRYAFGRADDHAGPVILDTAATAGTAGLVGTAFVSSSVEVRAGVDGGLVFGFDETPATSGTLSSGTVIAAHLSFRIWVARSVGVAVDGRFMQEELSFSGLATRVGGPLTDARLTRRDLTGSMGLATRF